MRYCVCLGVHFYLCLLHAYSYAGFRTAHLKQGEAEPETVERLDRQEKLEKANGWCSQSVVSEGVWTIGASSSSLITAAP